MRHLNNCVLSVREFMYRSSVVSRKFSDENQVQLVNIDDKNIRQLILTIKGEDKPSNECFNVPKPVTSADYS